MSRPTGPRPDIVFLGHLYWEPRWQRPQHLVRSFLDRGHRVFYVNPQLNVGAPGIIVKERDGAFVVVELRSATGPSIHRADPWSGEDLRLLREDICQLAAESPMTEPLLFVQSPGWWPGVTPIREILGAGLVYDCLDEHTGWDSSAAAAVRAAEDSLAAASDLVIASAEPLFKRLSARAWNIILVRNGCDFDRFRIAESPNGRWKVTDPRPLVGFYGALGHAWFDVQLVLAAAAMRPDWSFVLIGPAYGDVAEAFAEAENVHLTGEMPWEDLPELSADFDVATIPWLVNDLTEATDPVKLWEYFAAGKPVVATPLPELFSYQGLLDIVDDPSGLVASVEKFLMRPGDTTARQTLAQQADWGARLDLFHEEMLAVRGR